MTALSRSDIPRLPRGVRLHFDQVRKSHMLLAPERAFNINKSAAVVIELIDGRRSIGDIVDLLALQFGEPPAALEADVITMLGDLSAKRVVER